MTDKKKYIDQMTELYRNNTFYNFIVYSVVLTEKIFKKAINGEDKKRLLKKTINDIIDPEDKINDEYIDNIIDMIVFILNHKKLIHIFKKPCISCIK